jgi:hypothetical protein
MGDSHIGKSKVMRSFDFGAEDVLLLKTPRRR